MGLTKPCEARPDRPEIYSQHCVGSTSQIFHQNTLFDAKECNMVICVVQPRRQFYYLFIMVALCSIAHHHGTMCVDAFFFSNSLPQQVSRTSLMVEILAEATSSSSNVFMPSKFANSSRLSSLESSCDDIDPIDSKCYEYIPSPLFFAYERIQKRTKAASAALITSPTFPDWAAQPQILAKPLNFDNIVVSNIAIIPRGTTQQPSLSENMDEQIEIPPWLLIPLAGDKKSSENLSRSCGKIITKLTVAMNIYLTTPEISAVFDAIDQNVGNDLYKKAGLGDFLLILVETMEMGHHALIAATFHYCSCIKAAKREHLENGNMDKIEGENLYLCSLAGTGIENFGTEVIRIGLDAARLKGTESLAARMSSQSKRRLTRTDAGNLRSLLLSVRGDWRALAIRVAACLYRLRGLDSHRLGQVSQLFDGLPALTSYENKVCREALHIYAPLAHRLGFNSLKIALEGTAFRLLYRRQYMAVSKMYSRSENSPVSEENTRGELDVGYAIQDAKRRLFPQRSGMIQYRQFGDSITIGEGMKEVMDDVTQRMKRVLQEDDVFMENIASVSVTARIKEPYSLWKKMLRIRAQRLSKMKGKEFANSIHASSCLPSSVTEVHDAIALRVVLRTRKLTPDEDDEVTEARDRALCYYVQELCRDRWPAVDEARLKDYIKSPKPNGYQSLHYSSQTRWHGENWPFELQVRSADMHRVAEYGIAAHFDYKIGSQLDVNSDLYLKNVEECLQQNNPNEMEVENISPSKNFIFENYDTMIRVGRKRERDERQAPYLKALSETRMDMAREKVIVMLTAEKNNGMPESGAIISLPSGACVLDALREGKKKEVLDISLSSASGPHVYRNGMLTGITEQLRSGDMLVVPIMDGANELALQR